MKLYYTPGACSLAPHIVLREAGLPFDLVKVDLRNKTIDGGADFKAINAKGSVPALGLDGGELLTENATILQYIADQAPGDLLPASGLPRYRVLEWATFITTELHKGIGPLFNPATPADQRERIVEAVSGKLAFVEERLTGDYLTGAAFTVADAYLFVILNWAAHHKIAMDAYPRLGAFHQRVAGRPKVRDALVAEGLA